MSRQLNAVLIVLLMLVVRAQVLAAQFCVNINSAPAEDLEAIVQIGSARAAEIVELRKARPFQSVDDLERVNGIGPSRLAEIKKQNLACASTRPAASTLPTAVASASDTVCVLSRVADGDTFDCRDGRTVRLLLVDTPEMDQKPFGSIAKQMLEGFVPLGTSLRLEFDVQRKDQYQRTLAYAWLPDGRLINDELLRVGVATVAVYPPNVRYVDRFRMTVAGAREANLGLWAVDGFKCPPDDHRVGRC